MWKWIKALDGVLRGDATRPANMREGMVDIPVGGLTVLLILLGAVYGLCMGSFALFNRETPQYMQPLASMVKVPALFLLTLLVTLPSLYVFNALLGSRLGAASLLRLLVASLAVSLAVLGSFGPIVAFFSVSTTSYPFMLILNVLLFAVAGVLGLGFLLRTMSRLTAVPAPPPIPAVEQADAQPGALERMPAEVADNRVRMVFAVWVVVFGLVGSQMSWVLRPFIGAPDAPFTLFRVRESNFFEAVRRTLAALLG